MIKSLLQSTIGIIRLPLYKISYHLIANAEYFGCILRGLNTPQARLHYFPGKTFTPISPSSANRLALFVAHHPSNSVPISNKKYLEALKSAGFRIIYIHNGFLPEDVINSLSGLCCQVFCRLNLGQDFGAWKDGYLFSALSGILDGVEWLLMCNDSNFYLGGERGLQFTNTFQNELDRSDVDLIALNKNYELWQHYQSYFLCYRRRLFMSSAFSRFWRDYRPLSHRYHAINNGEIALTKLVLENISASVIYESTSLWEGLMKADLSADEFYSLLPQNAMYLRSHRNPSSSIRPYRIQQILALLDSHNPSHAYALLFVRYLSSPFLKKDLTRQGVCSLPQISSLLMSASIEYKSALWSEIISSYQLSGIHTSYIRYPWDAFRKGINAVNGSLFKGYGDCLSWLGFR